VTWARGASMSLLLHFCWAQGVLEGCSFLDNTADVGGAINVDDRSNVVATDCHFNGRAAPSHSACPFEIVLREEYEELEQWRCRGHFHLCVPSKQGRGSSAKRCLRGRARSAKRQGSQTSHMHNLLCTAVRRFAVRSSSVVRGGGARSELRGQGPPRRGSGQALGVGHQMVHSGDGTGRLRVCERRRSATRWLRSVPSRRGWP